MHQNQGAMRYKVEILENLIRTEIVSASSKEEAEKIIRGKYRNEEIILDAESFCSVEYHVEEED